MAPLPLLSRTRILPIEGQHIGYSPHVTLLSGEVGVPCLMEKEAGAQRGKWLQKEPGSGQCVAADPPPPQPFHHLRSPPLPSSPSETPPAAFWDAFGAQMCVVALVPWG